MTFTYYNTDDIFDIFVKDFFKHNAVFSNVKENKVTYPHDIFKTKTGLIIELPAIGLEKSDITISVKNDVLRVEYTKNNGKSKSDYIHKGITRKSFNLGWTISNNFDLNKIGAKMDKGLLSIEIPYKKESIPVEKNIEIY